MPDTTSLAQRRPHDYAADLVATVNAVAERLSRLSDDVAMRRPAPGKWSIKEIVGHLVDSASINHERFVRARWQEDLVFLPYEQDRWVEAQDHRHAPWAELLELWRLLNLHIARVMASTPADVRLREHRRHNLDRLAWRPVSVNESTTLEYFMRDYVGHLHHHVAQIEALLG